MNVSKLICATTLVVLGSASVSAQAQTWRFELEPYLFASSIEGDASVGRVDGAPVDLDFGDIMETLNSALMIHFEGLHENGWGMKVDYSFMDLRDDISTPRDGVVKTKLRQGVLQVDMMRRVELEKGTLDYSVGVRWWDNDVKAGLDSEVLPGDRELDVSQDWVDLVVGLRWQTPITEQWTFVAQGDIGGLGLEAEFTSFVTAGVKYRFNQTFYLDLNYRAIWVDYEDGKKGQPGYFVYDTVTHGPVVGLIYKF